MLPTEPDELFYGEIRFMLCLSFSSDIIFETWKVVQTKLKRNLSHKEYDDDDYTY